jgi:hypothetical protein
MSLGLPRADGVPRGRHAGALAVGRLAAGGHREIVELVDPSVRTVPDRRVAPGQGPEVVS